MCNFSILCRKRVAVGGGLDEDSHSLGRRVALSSGPRYRIARKRYLKMRALQQLTCLIGNDEYMEKRIMKWGC